MNWKPVLGLCLAFALMPLIAILGQWLGLGGGA